MIAPEGCLRSRSAARCSCWPRRWASARRRAPARRPCPTPVEAAPAAPASDLAYQGDISFWNTMRDFEFVHVQSLVDQWMTAHPGITVKHDLVPFDFGGVRTTKYLPAALNGTAPDIFRSDVAWTPGFADQGILADLTSYFTADELADFLPGPLGTTTYQGKTYAVPHVTDALGLMCNKQLLADAGLDHAPATWDELVEAGKKVTDLDAQKYGFYTRGDSYWALPFIWSWGGGLVNVDENGNPVRDPRQQPRVGGRPRVPQEQHPRRRRAGDLGLPDRLRQHERGLQGRHDHVHPAGPLAGGGHPDRRRLQG